MDGSKYILNSEAALVLLAGKTSIYLRLLNKFLQSLQDGWYNIETQLQESKQEDAARAAHSLKGICLNVGAERLHLVAVEMDQAFKNEDLTTVKQLLPVLVEERCNAKQAIEHYLEQQNQTSN